ncbi:MAG: hypothetical protein PHH26_00280 [Candidatus Thermoplasmatota archaeon]|nr:hypothetical protein [Candidatus Thermoplasmatota archaeon]
MPTIKENLEAEVRAAEENVRMARGRHISYKEALRQAELSLRRVRHDANQAYTNWKNARRELARAKARLSSYPSKSRNWAKENIGKILGKMEA